MYRRLLVLLAVLLAAVCAVAQRRAPSVDLTVRISYPNEQPGNAQMRVQLLTPSGMPITETQADSSGQVDFVVASGSYRLRVSGTDIETATTAQFAIMGGEVSHTEFVQVRPRKENGTAPSAAPAGTISAAEFKFPKKARDEYEQGNQALAHNDWPGARKHFEKAVEIAPQFASAENNLGVACTRLNDAACARQAFQAAIRLEPKLTPACLNLARVEFKAHDFPQVQTLLKKYLAVSPQDAEALTLLSEAELVTQQYEAALADARKVNALPQHASFPIAHYVAARALEAQQHGPEAATEYEQFLTAQPDAPQAATARAALERLRAH
jgi:hypothetical protein